LRYATFHQVRYSLPCSSSSRTNSVAELLRENCTSFGDYEIFTYSHSNFYINHDDVTRVVFSRFRFFFLHPSSCSSSRPTILPLRRPPSCSYIVAAARLVNIITSSFYFHDFFTSSCGCWYICYYRCSLSLFTTLWPFLCKVCKGNANEFDRLFYHSCSRFIVTYLPDTYSGILQRELQCGLIIIEYAAPYCTSLTPSGS